MYFTLPNFLMDIQPFFENCAIFPSLKGQRHPENYFLICYFIPCIEIENESVFPCPSLEMYDLPTKNICEEIRVRIPLNSFQTENL